MNKCPKKYNRIFKLIKTKEFKESFETAVFRTRLSGKIHRARVGQKISQDELSTLAQTTQRIISDIENGNYNMGVDLLYKIFKSLKKQLIVDGEDLVTGEQVAMTKMYFIENSGSGNSDEEKSKGMVVTSDSIPVSENIYLD